MTQEIIDKVFKKGINLIKDGKKESVKGVLSITYIPQFGEYVICWGTSISDASFVRVNEYNKTWCLKD